MLLDPFTIVAQIVNFAILVFALKRLLYDRVLRAMDEREASIERRFRAAEEREAEAAVEAENLRQERETLSDRLDALVEEARQDAERQRVRLLDEARADVDEERSRWERALELEKHELRDELGRRTADEVVGLTRKVLADLADQHLEAIVLTRALDRMAADHAVLAELLAARTDGTPLIVRTGFPVSAELRRAAIDRLHSMGLGVEGRIRFQQEPGLLLGVEVQCGGTALSWHADDHLDRFAVAVDRLVAGVDQPAEARHG